MKVCRLNPAEVAANEAMSEIYRCIDSRTCFKVEAGAGAGKTYSLVLALQHIISNKGHEYLKSNKKVACITYTNVAKNEILGRIDNHPVIQTETIHSFCWSIIKDFQPHIRRELPSCGKWTERLADIHNISDFKIIYDIGIPYIKNNEISLHHGDVIIIAAKLLAFPKFQMLLAARFPVIFIDEYQDTNKLFASAINDHLITQQPVHVLVGLFGDPWQKIYGDGCGDISNPSLSRIGLKSNFRSVKTIVESLNKIRPELPQAVTDESISGSIFIFHTNNWNGQRRNGPHWNGDLFPETAHSYLELVKGSLVKDNWNLSVKDTKILMLTHNILASELGYSALLEAFGERRDDLFNADDPHIDFFSNVVEPSCAAYSDSKYGDMFLALGQRTPTIHSVRDKQEWKTFMEGLLNLRLNGSIGEVIDYIKSSHKIYLPDKLTQREQELALSIQDSSEEKDYVARLRKIKVIPYTELIELRLFINKMTPFSTKHGVKGEEYENVLVVFGRGWNQYNFSQFLEESHPSKGTIADLSRHERNRNLFYVACSRPKKRLALLFTQLLSTQALNTLSHWFGEDAIIPLQ